MTQFQFLRRFIFSTCLVVSIISVFGAIGLTADKFKAPTLFFFILWVACYGVCRE